MMLLLPVFVRWGISGTLSSGDWGYRFVELSSSMNPWVVSWSTYFGNGLGGGKMILAPLDTWYIITARIASNLSLPWEFTERIVWFIPLVIVAMFSSIRLTQSIVRARFSFLGILYVINTHFIMVLSGGQMGVVWAIAIAPLVIHISMHLVDLLHRESTKLVHTTCLVGVIGAIQLMFDARIFYVTVMVIVSYIVFVFLNKGVKKVVYIRLMLVGISAGLIIIGLHAYWILPLIIYRTPIDTLLSSVYLSSDALRFFSFADQSHTMSLLHPNWPENIFGKMSFLRPEFLVFPILAFSSLLFLGKEDREKKIKILFFAFMGLIGAFLAKGVNQPFGSLYEWMFVHVPGFVMFRDPTKFYVLISISYTVLIAYTLERSNDAVMRAIKHKKLFIYLRTGFFALLLSLLLFAFRDFYTGRIRGTLVPGKVPNEYVLLKDFLREDNGFARVLWVPTRSRYGYYDDNKRAISLETLSIASTSAFIPWITEEGNDKQLARYGVKYIVVPSDVEHELFVKDGKPDNNARQSIINAIDETRRYERYDRIDGISIWRTSISFGHAFFVDQPNQSISVSMISPAEYSLVIPERDSDSSIIFSETYNPYWMLSVQDIELKPKRTPDGLQEYTIPKGVHGVATVRYVPQSVVGPLLILAWVIFVGICIIIKINNYSRE